MPDWPHPDIQIFGTPFDSLESIYDEEYGTKRLMMCHGNFIPYIKGEEYDKPVVLGNIFTMDKTVLTKKLRKLNFISNMARYALTTLSEIRVGDIVVSKKRNKLFFYIVLCLRRYLVWIPPQAYYGKKPIKYKKGKKKDQIKAFKHYCWEKYCIELHELFAVDVDKELYRKIAIPRTITKFKDEKILEKLFDLLKNNLGKASDNIKEHSIKELRKKIKELREKCTYRPGELF